MSERKRLSLPALCAGWESLHGELLDREGQQGAADAHWNIEHSTSMHRVWIQSPVLGERNEGEVL